MTPCGSDDGELRERGEITTDKTLAALNWRSAVNCRLKTTWDALPVTGCWLGSSEKMKSGRRMAGV